MGDISTDRWIEVIQELLVRDVTLIGFTCGEAIRRRDLETIIESTKDRAATILFTTGEGLDDKRAKRLNEAGLSYIAVSLDHYEKKEHNRLRGSSKAFAIALDAINISLKNNFYTAVHLTARKDVTHSGFLYTCLEFVHMLGVHELRIIELMPTGRLICETRDVFLGEKERGLLKEFQRKVNRKKHLPKVTLYIEDENVNGFCAGTQHLYIDASGNVCPCDFVLLSFGNIKEETVEAALERLRHSFRHSGNKCYLLENRNKLKPLINILTALESVGGAVPEAKR